MNDDYTKVSDSAVKEFHRLAEVCLQGTVQLAIAADQRATALTGIFGAAAAGLLITGANLFAGGHSHPSVIAALGVAILILFIAAICCSQASKPVDFHVAGYEPKRLAASAIADDLTMLRYSAEDIQSRIDANRNALSRAARLLTVGRRTAVAALPAAILVFAVISWCQAGHPS